MAEERGLEIELYNQWFLLADLDKDGVVSGGEAVQFFSRSGLPQKPTLFKVWQYVAGDRPHLNRQEFYTAMKLVSLAQNNNGVLDDQQAMRLVNGLGVHVPPPRMQGLPIPQGINQQASAPTQVSAPQMPRTAAPPSIPGAFSAFPAEGQYPSLTPEQATAFQTAFSQLDTDNDGFVQGVECFPAFMRSGLPKQTLKDVWDVVAGNDGKLSRHQFVQCLYLIECTKRGMPVPKQLPSGQFPPVAGGMDISSMMGYQQSDIYSSAPLSVPTMPSRAAYQPGPPPQVAFQSQVPGLSAVQLAILPEAERTRLESEREAALQQEAERKKLEEERLAAAARREFFTQSLADLRMAQSKVSRTVVEAQQRLEMERGEADRMEADYTQAYEQFSVEHARAAPVVQALKRVEEEKAGLAQKLEALKATVAQLEAYDPDWEIKEKGECEAMNKEIAALIVRKESLQLVADGIDNQRSVLEAQVAALKEASSGMEAHLLTLREQVQKATAEGAADRDAIVALLKQVAPLYNKLYDTAKQAMVPLPAEALATVKREPLMFKYDPFKHSGAADLESFNDEGFRIVSALPPDDRLTNFTSPSLATAIDESEMGEEETTEVKAIEIEEGEEPAVSAADGDDDPNAAGGSQPAAGEEEQADGATVEDLALEETAGEKAKDEPEPVAEESPAVDEEEEKEEVAPEAEEDQEAVVALELAGAVEEVVAPAHADSSIVDAFADGFDAALKVQDGDAPAVDVPPTG